LLKKVAEREGKSRSELVYEIVIEWLREHAGLNPQISLVEVCNPVDELELQIVKLDLKRLVNCFKPEWLRLVSPPDWWLAQVKPLLPKARRLWARSGDKELGELINKIKSIVKQITGKRK